MKSNYVLPTRNDIRTLLLETIAGKAWERKQLIAEIIEKSGFTKAQLKDTSSDSLSTRLKSFVGTIINELLTEQAIMLNENKQIHIEKKLPDKKTLTEVFLNKYLTEEEIKDAKPSGKRNILKAVLGDLIKRKENEIITAVDVIEYLDGELRKNDSVYNNIIKAAEKSYPNTPLGNKLESLDKSFDACKKGTLKKDNYLKTLHNAVLECISLAGGEFFERLSMSLMIAAYGKKVIKDEITAGPTDNGIDGILIIRDELGFEEKILLQAKTKRKKGYIPLPEIREFLGVMSAERADKGILISNSSYHKESLKFVSKVNNLMLIDEKKLIELMEKHAIGLVEQDGISRLDEKLFLE
ncbi:MAG: restriction endonuclease [Clostridia bacterium]|nr:restriction endonuclease [Clostridia bacterium]